MVCGVCFCGLCFSISFEFYVLGMVSIFTYGFSIAEENFSNENVRLISLSSYNDLIEEAFNLNYVTQEQISSLKKWRENPATWGA